MRRARDHAHRPTRQRLRAGLRHRHGVARDEAGGRLVIRRGEIDAGAIGGRDGDGGDCRIGAALFDRIQHRVPATRLHRALNAQLLAEGASQIHVEAAQRSIRLGEAEGRIVILRHEANDPDR